MIPEKQLQEIRNYLDKSENPLFFFDDDADGSCSYILLRKYCGKGKGVMLKSIPVLDLKLFHRVEALNPDLIVVLDIAVLEQEFIDKCNVPILWIDHHQLLKREKVHYYNPFLYDKDVKNTSTTACCYEITKKDLWIATLGAIADWTIPDYAKEFTKKYPELFPGNIKEPSQALFETKIGFLAKILLFNLKGTTSEALKSVNSFIKIDDPHEILNQTSKAGTDIYESGNKYMKDYNKSLDNALKCHDKDDEILIYIYPDKKVSFTSELSNELLYKYPEKIIIVAREKGDELKVSFRSTKHNIESKVQSAIKGLNGRFGGHDHACGGVIKSRDFDYFINNLREELK